MSGSLTGVVVDGLLGSESIDSLEEGHSCSEGSEEEEAGSGFPTKVVLVVLDDERRVQSCVIANPLDGLIEIFFVCIRWQAMDLDFSSGFSRSHRARDQFDLIEPCFHDDVLCFLLIVGDCASCSETGEAWNHRILVILREILHEGGTDHLFQAWRYCWGIWYFWFRK